MTAAELEQRAAPRLPGGGVPARLAAAVGALSAALGAALGEFVADLMQPAASPVRAVAAATIDAGPASVKEWVVATLGTADKPAIIGTVTAVMLALGAAAGLLARRRTGTAWRAGIAALAVLLLLAAAAVLTRPGADAGWLLPWAVTALVGVLAFVMLLRRAPSAQSGLGEEPAYPPGVRAGAPRPLERRAFLRAGTIVGVASAGAVVAGQLALRAAARAHAAIRSLPQPRMPLPPLPTGLETQVAGISPLQTPADDFYRVDTALVPPDVDVDDWQLVIDGDVARRLTLSYDALLAMDLVERDISLACVSNDVGGEYAGSARWLGVLVADLLASAGIQGSPDQVLATSVDGFTSSTPLAALTDDRGAIVAVGMNGQPLPQQHGYPARLVTPGLYGYVGATKWLTRLTVTIYAQQQAYWTRRGWSAQGPMKLAARIDVPKANAHPQAGTVAVAGVAWGPRRGVGRVEVSIDNGPWQQATLGPEVGVDYWRQWHLAWEASSGPHTLTARVTDGIGDVQSAQPADPFPDGASGYHRISVTVG